MSVYKFKKGMASFYIVAFATLIMTIVATSFAVVVISEIARTSNNDLSQSAYDAALAGIEDAKLAYANYLSCLKKGEVAADRIGDAGDITCSEIIYIMQNPDCDMVARILGRIGKNDEGGEVLISETTSGSSNMNQAYTCVKINTILSNYRASLSSSNSYRTVKVQLGEGNAKRIERIKLSWHSNLRDVKEYNYNNFKNDRVVFKSLKEIESPTPPTLSLELIQTAENFTIEQLNGQTVNGTTDRATLYLVPSDEQESTKGTNNSTYIGVRTGSDASKSENKISKEQVARTNNLQENLPYLVYCPNTGQNSGDFACSVEIQLPDPIGGSRNDDTFMLVVSLPYGQPDTDFSIEFCGKDGCVTETGGVSAIDGIMNLNDMQISIDSTGRSNDLFRRVEVRMESTDASFSYPLYAIEASGSITKDMTVTSENGSYSNEPIRITYHYDDNTTEEQNGYKDVNLQLKPGVCKNGGTFSAWNTSQDGTGTQYDGNTTISFNNNLDLWAQCTEQAIRTINQMEYMQQFKDLSPDQKTAVLNSMTEDQQYQLKDKRDEKRYYIAKLKDGRVWMTQNLDHNIGDIDGGVYTPADTDITVDWRPGSDAITKGTGDTTWLIFSQGGDTTPQSYDPGNLCWDGNSINNDGYSLLNGATTCTDANMNYRIGNYYNWTAAVAMNDSSSYFIAADVDQSICPAGWMLPKKSTGFDFGSFSVVVSAYGWGSIYGSPLYFTLGGDWYGQSQRVKYEGFYWQSAFFNGNNASVFWFDYNDNYFDGAGDRYRGFSVRCMTR